MGPHARTRRVGSSFSSGPGGAYDAHLAPVYDVVYGRLLQQGRRRAMCHMALRPGAAVLEAGIGSGIGLTLYPRGVRVTGVDLSTAMLARSRARIRQGRVACRCGLAQMDAERIALASDSFDLVYAPYLLSAVGDPSAVVSELCRVCRPGGRVILLNHFLSRQRGVRWCEERLSTLRTVSGVRMDVSLEQVLAGEPVRVVRTEAVNVLGCSRLVVCERLVATRHASAGEPRGAASTAGRRSGVR